MKCPNPIPGSYWPRSMPRWHGSKRYGGTASAAGSSAKASTVAIVGPPNAGKSSLLNALLGEDRAIVSEVAGTTRDTIEESIVIGNVLVRLVDTAGIRTGAGRLESEGIERTRRALESARVALVVIDGSQPIDDAAGEILGRTKERSRVIFFNKADSVTPALENSTIRTPYAAASGIRKRGNGSNARSRSRVGVAKIRISSARTCRRYASSTPSTKRRRRCGFAPKTLQRGDPADLIAGRTPARRRRAGPRQRRRGGRRTAGPNLRTFFASASSARTTA